MRAILTKYLSLTNARPNRIKAWIEDSGGIIASVTQGTDLIPFSSHSMEAHWYVAQLLRDKLNHGLRKGCKFVGAGTRDGYAFITFPVTD